MVFPNRGSRWLSEMFSQRDSNAIVSNLNHRSDLYIWLSSWGRVIELIWSDHSAELSLSAHFFCAVAHGFPAWRPFKTAYSLKRVCYRGDLSRNLEAESLGERVVSAFIAGVTEPVRGFLMLHCQRAITGYDYFFSSGGPCQRAVLWHPEWCNIDFHTVATIALTIADRQQRGLVFFINRNCIEPQIIRIPSGVFRINARANTTQTNFA